MQINVAYRANKFINTEEIQSKSVIRITVNQKKIYFIWKVHWDAYQPLRHDEASGLGKKIRLITSYHSNMSNSYFKITNSTILYLTPYQRQN